MQIRYLEFTPAVALPMDCAPTAAIIGRTVAGRGLVLRDYATLRADGDWVRIGVNGYFGERATVHIADSTLPASIGDDVTVGRYALVHACTVRDRVVVGDTAVVMDGAHVGEGALITAGSLVPPRKRLAGGWVYDGNPATPVRPIGAGELAAAASAIRDRTASALVTASDLPPLDMAMFLPRAAGSAHPVREGPLGLRGAAYVAPTAVVAGDVAIGDDASVYLRVCRHRSGRANRDRVSHERAGQLTADHRRRTGTHRARRRCHDRTQRANGRRAYRRPRPDRDGFAARRRRRRRGGRLCRCPCVGRARHRGRCRMDMGGPAGTPVPRGATAGARPVRASRGDIRSLRGGVPPRAKARAIERPPR